MLVYRKISPPSALADYVQFYWVLEYSVRTGERYIHRQLADGSPELIFHYKGRFDELMKDGKVEHSFTSGIHAQAQHFTRFSIESDFGIFGAYLYPYAIPALFGVPANEMSNSMVDLISFFGQAGSALEEKMMVANNNEERVGIISGFLMQRLKNGVQWKQSLHGAVRCILHSSGHVNIIELANHYCLSSRQFERRFKEMSGFTPKLYSRIIRFRSVFDELKRNNMRLSEVALACGYYDQSHFIRDFQEFSGYNPKEFLTSNNADTVIYD